MPGIERYRRLKLCNGCGKEPEPGKVKCTVCLLKVQARCKDRRKRLHAEGKCGKCGKSNDRHPKQICGPCDDVRKEQAYSLKLEIFNAYGGVRCACCGDTNIEFLSIDHINNDGSQHRKQVVQDGKRNRRYPTEWKPKGNGTGVRIYSWLKRNHFPPGFQVLCMNCNFAKGHFGECPHERDMLFITN